MISFAGRNLTINGMSHELAHPIAHAIDNGDQIFVLFDPDAVSSGAGQFPNLVSVSQDGKLLWEAELPTTTFGDRYYKIERNEHLIGGSVFSIECTLNPKTGAIIKKEFVK